jgi:hypothetical protein
VIAPTRAQLRALQYLFNHELRLPRRPGGCDRWVGDGSFEVARVTVTKLVNRKLARVVDETQRKRCAITDLGRECVRRFLNA